MKTESEIKIALRKLAVYENKIYKEYSEAFDVRDMPAMNRTLDKMLQIRGKIDTLNWVLGNSDFLENEVGI